MAAGRGGASDVVSSSSLPIAVGDTFERYEIESLIGRGGMGEVYRAMDTRLRRKVALKVLRPDRENEDAVARLFREARAAAVLAHPNTVAIHDIGEADGTFYIVMELVTGSSLLAYVGDDRAPPARKLGWLVDVARALAAAHKAGVIHRDVKPSNVMVSGDGVVKVLDFGLAKPLAPVSFRTMQGHVLGTPRYMAPEQLAGAEVDARTDQYAFGLTAYELVAGKHPGGAIAGPMHVPPLDKVKPEVSREVGDVIARAMADDPEARFASMDDVAVALEDAIAGRAKRVPMPAGVRENSEITRLDVPANAAVPLSDTVQLGAPAARITLPAKSLPPTSAVSTKRAGGDGARIVATVPAGSTPPPAVRHEAAVHRLDSESEVPTATARTAADVTAKILQAAGAAGATGPSGARVDPMGATLESAPRHEPLPAPRADERTLMSREVPTPLAQLVAQAAAEANANVVAKTLVVPASIVEEAKARVEKAKSEARADADARARADADARAKADTDAKAKAKAKAEADARDRHAATAGRAPSTPPKKKSSALPIALVVLGVCAFAGAYFGSKEIGRHGTAAADSARAAPDPSVPATAVSAAPLLPSVTGTTSTPTVILSAAPSEPNAPTASATVTPPPVPTPTPTPRPFARPKPTGFPGLSQGIVQ